MLGTAMHLLVLCCLGLKSVLTGPRFFLACQVLVGSALLIHSGQHIEAADDSQDRTSDRPNIVFAFADDWGRYASAYGELEPGTCNDVVQTPNFDRIAKEGILFRNAFVNAPSCTPCRSSLLSGQYFWRCGRASILRGAIWDGSIPAYPMLLESGGYAIGHTYKVWSPGQPVDAPHGGARTRVSQNGRAMNRFSQFVSNADNPETAKKQLLNEVRLNIRDFLESVPEGQPFCYWFGPTNVHRTWTAGSGKDLWGIDPDQLVGKMPPFWPDVPIVRQDLADYLGEVHAWDAALGVLVEELERIDQFDNTLLAVSGDHGIPGFPCGKCDLYDTGTIVPLAIRWPSTVTPGIVLDDLVSLPDLAPTFLEAAGIPVPDVMTAKSLMPQLNAKESGTAETTRDAVFFGRERHVENARPGNLPYPMRGIRTQNFLYIYNFHPERWPMGVAPGFGLPDEDDFPSTDALLKNTRAAFADMDAGPTKAWIVENRNDPAVAEIFQRMVGQRPSVELFDLRSDRYQMTNVAGQAAYAEDQKRLHDRLFQTLRETEDPRLLDDGRFFETPPMAGPIVSVPKK
jgi:uncharacterized sulfatase